MVTVHTSKPLSDECPLCKAHTMVAARLPDTSVVIACTSCGVCSEPFPTLAYAQESWKHTRSYLRKKPTPDPELDSYILYYGKFRTCAARYVKYDRPMTCDREALDYARDYMRANGLSVVGVEKNLHPWNDLRHVAFVCDLDQIEVLHRASFDPSDTGYHRQKWMGPSFNRKSRRLVRSNNPVFPDTNVLVAYVMAKDDNALICAVFNKIKETDTLIVTKQILDELYRIDLTRRNITAKDITEALRRLNPTMVFVRNPTDEELATVNISDPNDRQILFSAREAGADVIITRDAAWFKKDVYGFDGTIQDPEWYLYGKEIKAGTKKFKDPNAGRISKVSRYPKGRWSR